MFRRKDEMAYRQKGIERFVEAQKRDYKTALSEIRAGHKETHWIWYVFPQMLGLGHSCYSNLYGIRSREEAAEYLNHGILGKRLREVTEALLSVKGKTAEEIFGGLDAMKVVALITYCKIMVSVSSYFSFVHRLSPKVKKLIVFGQNKGQCVLMRFVPVPIV